DAAIAGWEHSSGSSVMSNSRSFLRSPGAHTIRYAAMFLRTSARNTSKNETLSRSTLSLSRVSGNLPSRSNTEIDGMRTVTFPVGESVSSSGGADCEVLETIMPLQTKAGDLVKVHPTD